MTLPRDSRLVGVVRDVCAHASSYAALGPEAAAGFCERVVKATERAIGMGGPPCTLAFEYGAGELRVTVGGETVSQPLAN
jgi:hypothetical protein